MHFNKWSIGNVATILHIYHSLKSTKKELKSKMYLKMLYLMILFQHHILFFNECPTALKMFQKFFKYVRIKGENQER